MSEGIQGRVCLILCQTTFGDSDYLGLSICSKNGI